MSSERDINGKCVSSTAGYGPAGGLDNGGYGPAGGPVTAGYGPGGGPGNGGAYGDHGGTGHGTGSSGYARNMSMPPHTSGPGKDNSRYGTGMMDTDASFFSVRIRKKRKVKVIDKEVPRVAVATEQRMFAT